MLHKNYQNFYFGIEESPSVSKHTQALVRVNSSDCLQQRLGECEPHQTEKRTKLIA